MFCRPASRLVFCSEYRVKRSVVGRLYISPRVLPNAAMRNFSSQFGDFFEELHFLGLDAA